MGNSEDFDLVLEKAKVKLAELYKEKKRLENDLKIQVKKKRKLEEKYKSQNWLSRLDLIDLKLQDWTSMDWKISFFLLMIVVVILSVIIRNIILGVVLVCIGVMIFAIIDDKRNPEVLNNFILKEIERVNTEVNHIQKRIDEVNQKIGKLSLKDNEVIRGGRMSEKKKYVVKIENGYFAGYFAGYDETNIVFVSLDHRIVYDDLDEAQEDARTIGGEVEEL